MSEGTSFGRLVKARRRRLDLTQEELAKQVGYSVITIRKVEADERRPSRQLAERLALGLDIGRGQRSAFVALPRSAPRSAPHPASSPRRIGHPDEPGGSFPRQSGHTDE